jgi:LacI family transcriptional regulator
VAEECGFSLATVSNVLNDGPKPVKPETKRKILEAVERLNYHPNAVARGLARQKTHTIGILFGIVDLAEIVINAYSASVLQAVLAISADTGYNVTHLTRKWEGADVSLRFYRDGRTDGLLVVAPPTDSDLMPALASLGKPIVGVSADRTTADVVSVDVDDFHGAKLVMDHLLKLGHRRIAHITGHPNLKSGQIRRQVYLESLDQAGIAVRHDYLRAGLYSQECGYEELRLLMKLNEPPTALFAANDEIAFGAIEAARDMRLKVPNELSIIAVDDRPLASVLSPALTTLHQPFDLVGREASRQLIAAIEGEPIVPREILFRPELIVRQSTAPPPRF